jgi:formylglycine-generating enzyme required for sulfatase activity
MGEYRSLLAGTRIRTDTDTTSRKQIMRLSFIKFEKDAVIVNARYSWLLFSVIALLLAVSLASFMVGLSAREYYRGVTAFIGQTLPAPDFREPEMVVVPAGSFIMGSPKSEEGRLYDEGPLRRVTIAKPFEVAKYEITFEEWDRCFADGGCTTRLHDDGWGRGLRPAIHMSWEDASEYVHWLAKKTGKQYRLLTEAEWEYAARAGSVSRYEFGHSISTDEVHHSEEHWGSAGETAKVGSSKPNAFGLHDMTGNVWEWVEDCYLDSYEGAPSDGSARIHDECSFRVLRGGSWWWKPRYVRTATRYRYVPDMRNSNIGARVARSL